MKTSELTGASLDWAVAKCKDDELAEMVRESWRWRPFEYTPSTDWSQGGPIIEREDIGIAPYGSVSSDKWVAVPGTEREGGKVKTHGPTPLIAAMRCVVASKLGEDIDVPCEVSTR
jgi:hypothetical protein